MAVDMFMKLDGIKGESRDGKHKGEHDVLAWSWGASQSASMHVGGGGGSGKVSMQDLSFTKYIDVGTTALMLHCATGKHIATADLVVRKAGDKPLEYLKIKLSDVLISSISTGGSGGEDRLTENVSLNFAKILVEYSEQDEKGAGKAGTPFSWDIPKNEK